MVKRKVLIGVILILFALIIWQRDLLYYGYVQGKGQLSIIWEAKPLQLYLEDPAYPDSLKSKIKFIQEVKTFAFQQLGVNKTDNYTSMYGQSDQHLMWVVTGCKPYALEPKTWDFPIVGSFPYKGFFDEQMAREEMDRVQKEGYDVGVRNPGGWSTLGWFNDPVLSEMLNRDYGQLAELIIHELTHSTIFVKDSVTFNENLASFIGHEGAIMFLKRKYGSSSHELEQYLHEEEDYDKFVNHFIRGADKLDSLYRSMNEEMTESLKGNQKKELITEIVVNVDTLELHYKGRLVDLFKVLPNNTYFMSFLRYQSRKEDFIGEYEDQFDKNLAKFIAYYKTKYPFL